MSRPSRPHVAWLIDDTPGAWSRASAVVPHLASRCTVLSTGEPLPDAMPPDVRHVRLPWPPPGGACPPVVGGAPTGLGRDAAARLATFLADTGPDLVLADGLPHGALFTRQCGVPTVVVHRHDRAQMVGRELLDRAVVGFLAPYPALLEPAATPADVRRRTVHAGLISRFAGRRSSRAAGRRALGLVEEDRVVTVVCGGDGLGVTADDLVAAADATPDWVWSVLGRAPLGPADGPSNLRRLGWANDPWPALEAADVVVSGAGLSTVAEVASARRPLLLLPRPDRGDDDGHARLLAEVGAATALDRWPDAACWAATLEASAATEGRRLARLEDGRGAQRAAAWLDAWAATPPADLTGPHAPPPASEQAPPLAAASGAGEP